MEKLNKTRNEELKPNSLVLWGKEIITKACNVYKLSLTENQKAEHLLKFLKKTQVRVPESIDKLHEYYQTLLKNSDFYVFRIKPELIKICKEIESNGGMAYIFDDFNDVRPFSSIDLFESLSDYLTFKCDSTYYIISENHNTQVRLIKNWEFEEE